MSKRSATSSSHIGGLHEKSAVSSTKSEQESKPAESNPYRKHLRPRPAKPVDYRGTKFITNPHLARNSSDSRLAEEYSTEGPAPKRHCPDPQPHCPHASSSPTADFGSKVSYATSGPRSRKTNAKNNGSWGPFVPPAQSSDSEEDLPPLHKKKQQASTSREGPQARNLDHRLQQKKQKTTNSNSGGGSSTALNSQPKTGKRSLIKLLYFSRLKV